MYPKIALVAALLASVEARFGEEQSVANDIQSLSNFGNPGEAATLAGASPGVLLAGANACAKLQLADKIVAQLGNDAVVIAVAAKLVAAEKNTNPFVVSIPSICSDVGLPATAELRGIVPLIDPATTGSDVENANSASSLAKPLGANGLSVAQVAINAGFSNFTAQGSDGKTAAAADLAGGAAAAPPPAATTAAAVAASSTAVACTPVTRTKFVSAAPAAATTAAAAVDNKNNNNGVAKSTIAGLDFGLCAPTIKFEGGLGGRPATEFTFQAIDPLVSKGQQEALNPNIITNRICDQLTNVCEANAAAKAACLAAKAQILALGTRNADTANTWNTVLGFAGTDISPDA
ncbi:hypothetical protein B0T26DRAFT_649131 [Lasiosphaeria miniovina]|uniref:Uncharacterized protein n=1 Tax=Lasiosphaeria miniovina TaxID=1954250 RepID=A0AA40DUT4_9PEZI|nr:uncharacterized protein B0T26DRAFT_649131 [Lasiosphaeria miniovina]KAK0713991.1 hypothetical protein B0T26DRAFT_649131 [Lasiosphaeria miniovina]